jgi:hypothetical protein
VKVTSTRRSRLTRGWVALDLTAAPLDWQEVTELVETPSRQVALNRIQTVLEQQDV